MEEMRPEREPLTFDEACIPSGDQIHNWTNPTLSSRDDAGHETSAGPGPRSALALEDLPHHTSQVTDSRVL